jgi:hypothetical protein
VCVLGAALAGGLLLTTPFTGCTDVGVPDDANTGSEFLEIANGNILYSPDGVNTCQSPVAVVVVPFGLSMTGVVLFVYGYHNI